MQPPSTATISKKAGFGRKSNPLSPSFFLFLLLAFVHTAFPADSITFDNDWNKSRPDSGGPDYVQYQAAGPGWFTNLGPTGIRAMMTDSAGKTVFQGKGIQFVVKYIFPNSPAANVVKVGDVIYGANGLPFKTVYIFGYWWGFGYEGPITEFGKAVEDAESKNKGALSIMLRRNGSPMTVTVQLPMQETFSATWPYNCPKSQKLRNSAVKWIVDNQKADGRWQGYAQGNFLCALALLAQGTAYLPQVEKYLDMASKDVGDYTWNWNHALYGIVMAEYTLVTKNTKYLPAMNKLCEYLRINRRFKNGTYGHESIKGSDGYGPMAGLTTLVALSFALMEKAGATVPKTEFTATMVTLDMELTITDATRKPGDYSYGWPNFGSLVYTYDALKIPPTLDHANIDIKAYGPDLSVSLPRGGMTLLHSIKPWQSYSPALTRHFVNKIARARRNIVNGHGSGYLQAGISFLALAQMASKGYTEPLRYSLDENLSILNSARNPDGTFYTQPTRDDYGNDMTMGSRTIPTGLWALVLSIPDKGLVMFGKSLVPVNRATPRRAPAGGPWIEVTGSGNPAILTIAKGIDAQSIAIFDLRGKRVELFSGITDGKVEWNTQGRQAGFYVAQALIDGDVWTQKFILR